MELLRNASLTILLKYFFWPLYWNLWETSHSLNLLRFTFLVTWHDMGVPQQTNPTLLSSSQSPKPTFKVRWGPCLVSSETHLQHSEWGAEPVWSFLLSYWSRQQLANLVKSQTCKESHVHDNVLVFLPNCEYTYQKAFSDLLKICTFLMMVQGRLYVEKKAFWKFFFFFHSFLSSQMNMFTFQIRVMLTDCWFKWCL